MRARREKHVRRSLQAHIESATDPRHDRPRRHRAARAAAAEAERLGLISRPDRCERCGDAEAFLERHHADHAKPLCVAYLCAPCHRIADAELSEPQREPDRADCA